VIKVKAILWIVLLAAHTAWAADDSLFRVTKDRTLWGNGKNFRALELMLGRGGFIFMDMSTGDIPWLITAGMTINAPPEEVYSVITDFEKYVEYMPQLDSAEQKDPGDGFTEVTYTLGFRFAYVIPLSITYTLKYYYRPPLRLDWVGIKEGEARHYGYWELVPMEGGKKTAAFYSLYSTPQWGGFEKILKKSPWLLPATVLSTALIVIQKIKERVEGEHPIATEHTDVLTEKELKGSGIEALSSNGIFLTIDEPDSQGRKFVSAVTLVNASPEAVWETINNAEAAPIIYPDVEKVTVIKGDDGGDMAKFNLNINYILFYKRVSYVIKYVMEKPKRLSWTWVKGDAKDVTGSWDLIPIDGGEKTLALHRMYTDLKGSSVIARYILTRQPALEMAVQASTAFTVVKGMKSWTEMSLEERDKAIKAKAKKKRSSDGDRPSIPGY